MLGVGQQIDTQVIYTDDDSYFLALVETLLSDDEYGTPKVISMSYGGSEQVLLFFFLN